MKHPILVNRQRRISTLSDKAELTGFRFTRPQTLPEGAEPFTVIDVDGKKHDTIIKRNTDKKHAIGIYDEHLAGKYHGRLSRHWKPEQHTADGIIKILNAGYSVAPGLYDNPPDKSHRSGNYRVWTDVVLFDGDEWTESHPAPESIDALIERYPTIPEHFYWVAESISSRSSLKPYLNLRLMMILPEPIRRDDPWTWNAMVNWVTDLYPFIATGVAADKVRLSFGNARPGRSERRFGKVLDTETLNLFRQRGAAALAEHLFSEIEKTKQRTAQTERREKSEQITEKLKSKGIEIPDTQEPISTFNKTNIETLLIGLGCSQVKGNDWNWHESGPGKSFTLYSDNPPVIECYSNSIKAHNPNSDDNKPVEAHRLIAYYLYGLDMSKDSDKSELRKRLAEDGYGTSPEEYKQIQETKRNVAISQGLIPPQVKRYKVNPDYEHKKSDIGTERDANKSELIKWIESTEKKKGKHLLILGSAAGTGKTTAATTTIESFIYVAKTSGEADNVFKVLDDTEQNVMRHRPRMYNYNHPDWETLPLGLGDNERPCISPNLCDEHIKKLGTPSEVCYRCPVYDNCKSTAFISQADKERHTAMVVYAWDEAFLCDEKLKGYLQQVCTKDKIFILDEANPLSFTQERTVKRDMLFDLTERFRQTLGANHEIYQTLKALLNLISTAETPSTFINELSDWIQTIADPEAFDDKISEFPVRITFKDAPDHAEHDQPFHAEIRYRDNEVDIPVVHFDTHETTDGFYTENAITLDKPETRFMPYGFLLNVGLASLESPPHQYCFVKDIKTFFDENSNIDAAPFTFDPKDQTFDFYLKPTLNHSRAIVNTASDPDNLISEAYRETPIKITRHDGTPPEWKSNLVFQVASGTYLPRHSLIAKDGNNLKLKRYAEDTIESFIKPSIEAGLKTLVIAPKAFQEIESVMDSAVTDPDEYIPSETAILTNHHRAEGRNDYQDCDIAFVFHYEPNHHNMQTSAKHIYRNSNEPLDFTREKQTIEVNSVSFEKNTYTDKRVQDIYNRECRARLMQSAMRLRPNINANKTIVFLTAEPIDIPMTPIAFTPGDAALFKGNWEHFKDALQAKTKAIENGDVKTLKELTGKSKRTAERDTKEQRQQAKVERDALVIKLHQDGLSQRNIHAQVTDAGHKVSIGTINTIITAFRKRQTAISNTYNEMSQTEHLTNPDNQGIQDESAENPSETDTDWRTDPYYSAEAIRERLKIAKAKETATAPTPSTSTPTLL